MNDDELRRRFEALRRDDERSAPDYRGVLGRARAAGGPRSPWRLAAATAAAGLAVVAFLALLSRPEAPPAPWTPGQWVMPTDVLLELPGQHLLRETPTLGVPETTPAPPLPRTGSLRRKLG